MGAINTNRKGSAAERRSMAILEAAGYTCVRSSGSHSIWDIWGYSATGFVLCQVKSGNWPGSVETEGLRLAVVPPNCLKLVHRWRAGQKAPDVRVLG